MPNSKFLVRFHEEIKKTERKLLNTLRKRLSRAVILTYICFLKLPGADFSFPKSFFFYFFISGLLITYVE